MQETISACLGDIRDTSSSPEKRRAAVLVLGKYDTPEVTDALGECLYDDDVVVRRSALVAISEIPMRLRLLAGSVINCLKDEDVHVRRLASSSLDLCLGGVVSGGVRISAGRAVQTQSRTGLARLLEDGLRDEDKEVRVNVLRSLRYSSAAVDFHAVLPFLEDDSPEVVCMAIQAIVNGSGAVADRLKVLKPFVRHENAAVRGVLCEKLAELPGALEFLRELSKDNVEDVRLVALIARGNLRDPNDSGLVEEMKTALSSGGLNTDKGERLLSLLASLSEEGAWRFVHDSLFDDSHAEVREAAWLQMLRHAEWQRRLNAAEMAAAMSRLAGNPRIRSMLISMLRKRAGEIGSAEVETLLSSPLASCRRSLLELVRNSPDERQEQILMELLMDDDAEIRLQAVRQISSMRPEGWEEILIATLEDPDDVLQLAAAQGLVKGGLTSQNSRDALRVWLPNCHDAAFRLRLERQLMQR
ncbi:MAG: HEAT repeat domain-containing protein [Lentisphaeria bacterium]|nr:HEAT repeat domain-containing protein [Lentisphaeria bacterium]